MTAARPFTLTIARSLGLTAMFIGFQLALTILIGIGLALLSPGGTESFDQELPTILLFANSGAAFLVVYLERTRQRLPWRFLPPARASFAWILFPALLITVGTTATGSAITEVLNRLLPSFFAMSIDMEELFNLARHPVTIPLTVLVVAPLTEEILFRGLILSGLLRTRSPRAAILISAALFSGMHLNPAQLPATFLIGLTYGWIYYRTRSLWLCIFAHLVHNTIAMLGTAHNLTLDEADQVTTDPQLLLIFAIGAILLSVGLALLARSTPPPAPEAPPPLPTTPLESVTQ